MMPPGPMQPAGLPSMPASAFNPVVNQPMYEPVPPPATALPPKLVSASAAPPPTLFNPANAAGAPALHSTGGASIAAAAAESPASTAALPSGVPHVPSYQSAPPSNYGWNDPPPSGAGNNKPTQPSNLRKLKPPKTAVAPMELPAGTLNPAAYVPQQHHRPAMVPPFFGGVACAVPGAAPPNAWMAPNTVDPSPAPTNGVASHPPADATQPHPAAAPPHPVPASATPKKPIPAEHQMLYDTFAEALKRCVGAAKNPVMKRKLDDVGKKMEILAEKLREGGVSAGVLAGLRQMATAVAAKDYQNGLKVYAAIVRGGNFAEISSFMPGLKTLMQSATQLRV